MNKTVTVTGMEMKTTVGSNLLISSDTTESNFKTAINQTVTGTLEPVSTMDGINYFYTVQAAADGQKLATQATYEELTEPGTSDTAFQSAYGSPSPDAAGYIDYVFYLKATSSAGSEKVALTKCNLYREASTSSNTKTEVTDKAWRVAMFTEQVGTTSCGSGSAAATANLKTVLGFSGADYFTGDKGVKQAAAGENQLADVTNWSTAANVDTTAITKGSTQYYKVIVRLWLEGEDASCTNATYAPLDSIPYHLDLRFDLVPSTDTTHPVTTITSDTTWDPTAAQTALS